MSHFFYADADSAFYDSIAPLTDPTYNTIHALITEMLQEWVEVAHPDVGKSYRLRIADVGAGTGVEAVNMLSELPDLDLVCVDNSDAMLECLRSKMDQLFGKVTASKRCCAVNRDVTVPGWLGEALTCAWGAQAKESKLDAVVSVHMLHHFSIEEKMRIYREIHSFLKPNGIFINADLFSFDTLWLTRFVQNKEESWLAEQLSNAANEVFKENPLLEERRERMRDQWIEHLRNDNFPLPVDRAYRSCTSGDELRTEAEILHASGFSAVECVFRHYQAGIVFAAK